MPDIKEIERSIIKQHRKYTFAPFVSAVTNFKMINDGDVIGLEIDGSASAYLLAKCLQEIKRHGKAEFSLVFFACSNQAEQCEKLGIQLAEKTTEINKIARPMYFEQATEIILDNLLNKGKIGGVVPNRLTKNPAEILPLIYVKAKGISLFSKFCEIEFNEKTERPNIRELIDTLKQDNPLIEYNILKSVENVNLNTVISYISDGEEIDFLKRFENNM